MKSNQFTLLNATSAATVISAAQDVNQAVSISAQFVTADATQAGTLKLQGSNDNKGDNGLGVGNAAFVPTNWSDIPNATSTITAGTGPMIVVPNACFAFIRAVFTRSAGTSANIKVNTTVINP